MHLTSDVLVLALLSASSFLTQCSANPVAAAEAGLEAPVIEIKRGNFALDLEQRDDKKNNDDKHDDDDDDKHGDDDKHDDDDDDDKHDDDDDDDDDDDKHGGGKPNIPGFPSWPPKNHGKPWGHGWGSEKPNKRDRKNYEEARKLAKKGRKEGRYNAAGNLDHYLDNSGRPRKNNVDKLLDDVRKFEDAAEDLVSDYAREAYRDLKKKKHGGVKTFASKWEWFDKIDARQLDWYAALQGKWAYSVSGVVKVEKQRGGKHGQDKYVAQVWWVVYLWDWYEWDGKQLTGHHDPHKKLTEDDLARLHRVKLAREYLITGESKVHHVKKYDGGKIGGSGHH